MAAANSESHTACQASVYRQVAGGWSDAAVTQSSGGRKDFTIQSCQRTGCRKRPIYGLEGSRPEYCSDHKHGNMVNVRNPLCRRTGCRKQPTYAFRGHIAEYCSGHKLEGMMDVIARLCEVSWCQIHPNFGYEGGKARFCASHKLPDMINVKTRHCAHQGCLRQSIYAHEGQRGRWCSKHKQPNMMDVSHRRCRHRGCGLHPSYGEEGGRLVCCLEHKLPGMVARTHRTRSAWKPADSFYVHPDHGKLEDRGTSESSCPPSRSPSPRPEVSWPTSISPGQPYPLIPAPLMRRLYNPAAESETSSSFGSVPPSQPPPVLSSSPAECALWRLGLPPTPPNPAGAPPPSTLWPLTGHPNYGGTGPGEQYPPWARGECRAPIPVVRPPQWRWPPLAGRGGCGAAGGTPPGGPRTIV